MNEAQTTHRAPVDANAGQGGLIDLVIILARSKRLLVGLPLAVAILAILASLALPDMYKASTKLLPPKQAESGAAAMLAQLGGMGGLAAGMAGLKSPNEVYIGMLNSRTVADRLLARFKLKEHYGLASTEKARTMLAENTQITVGKDGLITIEVEDGNRQLVAPLANAYVDELLNLTKVLAVSEAGQRRMFYEQQLEQAKRNLVAAEVKLKGSLDTRGVISVDGQSRAIVETVSRLRAQVSAKEIQLGSMQAFVTENNPQYRRVREELLSLRAELSRLENGRPAAQDGDAAPQGLENIQTLRDVKYYQMLYELLAKQYEAARLDEAKEASVVQVLDPALEPERKFKPKRVLIGAVAALVALLAAIAIVFLREAKQRMLQTPAGAANWRALQAQLRNR